MITVSEYIASNSIFVFFTGHPIENYLSMYVSVAVVQDLAVILIAIEEYICWQLPPYS